MRRPNLVGKCARRLGISCEDLSVVTGMMAFPPALVTWVASGAVFIARGRRYGAASSGPELSFGASPTRGGALGALTLQY